MNILHIAPNATYNEGWGYQENLLPKYHARMGHNVTLIVRNRKFINGLSVETECEDYISPSGFRVIREKVFIPSFPFFGVLFSKLKIYPLLLSLKPDFVFFHGLVSSTIFQVSRYKKNVNPSLVIVQDNHLDYNIGFHKSMPLKHKILVCKHRIVYAMNNRFVSKVYGVTPWRKQYAEEVFGVPSSKTDVLNMGADDDCLDFENRVAIRNEIREKYDILPSDFLIVTGGKIDSGKKIDVLMRSVKNLPDVKLLIFGHVLDNFKDEFQRLLRNNNNIIYIGWIDSFKVYDYFFAADLVFFPGQHSVLWEQACAAKVPCVFAKWEGMDHLNNGGNADFVSPVNESTIYDKIKELKFTPKYYAMSSVANSSKTDVYLYSKIAEKSLECIKKK